MCSASSSLALAFMPANARERGKVKRILHCKTGELVLCINVQKSDAMENNNDCSNLYSDEAL